MEDKPKLPRESEHRSLQYDIRQALAPIMPENVAFMVIHADVGDHGFLGFVSNLKPDSAKELLALAKKLYDAEGDQAFEEAYGPQ